MNDDVKNLNELKEINKELTSLEKKLEEIPNPTDERYNRHQRRQLKRQMISEEKKKQNRVKQLENTPVTRREFVGLFKSAQMIRDRLYYVDVLVAAIEKLLLEKRVITELELKETIRVEAEKAIAFQNIQKEEKNYESRLLKCRELDIDPNISNIGKQLYEDSEVTIEDKLRLAKEFNLMVLLKALNNEVPEDIVA